MKMAFDPRITSPGIANRKEEDGLKRLCQDFEAIFINTLFKEMRKTVPDQGYLDRNMGLDMFQEMMDMEVAREMSRKGGFGLGRSLYGQLRGRFE
ncbi:MAG: rod-binding protein [Desulfohalobiaceae bacterium]|nr:rod-binding protein [Desulfohalobiaceae bacterium]